MDEHHKDRQGDPNLPENHVYMPVKAQEGTRLPVSAIDGLAAFLLSIVSAAKDWQDNMQSTLSGYRERIARIALTEIEGGLNLTMPPEHIAQLTDYGARAGKKMCEFNFNEHR